MFLGRGVTDSSIQAAGAPGGGERAEPKVEVVETKTKAELRIVGCAVRWDVKASKRWRVPVTLVAMKADFGVGADVRLVEGCGVDDGGDVWVRVEDALDGVGGCDVHEKGGGGRGEDVDSYGGEAEGGEGQHEGTAKVARGAGDENEGGLFVGHCR